MDEMSFPFSVKTITKFYERQLEELSNLMSQIVDNAKDLRQQRDALLAACEAMLHIFDRDLPVNSIGRAVCDEARAAIAAARGEDAEPAADRNQPQKGESNG